VTACSCRQQLTLPFFQIMHRYELNTMKLGRGIFMREVPDSDDEDNRGGTAAEVIDIR